MGRRHSGRYVGFGGGLVAGRAGDWVGGRVHQLPHDFFSWRYSAEPFFMKEVSWVKHVCEISDKFIDIYLVPPLLVWVRQTMVKIEVKMVKLECSKSQICQYFITYANLRSKNWSNLKTNWYKHFWIHFKHAIVSVIFLFSFKERIIARKSQQMPIRGVKITN